MILSKKSSDIDHAHKKIEQRNNIFHLYYHFFLVQYAILFLTQIYMYYDLCVTFSIGRLTAMIALIDTIKAQA